MCIYSPPPPAGYSSVAALSFRFMAPSGHSLRVCEPLSLMGHQTSHMLSWSQSLQAVRRAGSQRLDRARRRVLSREGMPWEAMGQYHVLLMG